MNEALESGRKWKGLRRWEPRRQPKPLRHSRPAKVNERCFPAALTRPIERLAECPAVVHAAFGSRRQIKLHYFPRSRVCPVSTREEEYSFRYTEGGRAAAPRCHVCARVTFNDMRVALLHLLNHIPHPYVEVKVDAKLRPASKTYRR